MNLLYGPINTPQVLQSLIAQCLEHPTSVQGLRFFSLRSHARYKLITSHIIHFFTELKIYHLSLYMTPR